MCAVAVGASGPSGTRAPMALPLMPNQRWSLDFVSDQLTDGRRFRILTVVDDCTRECLALIADTSLSGARVARELTALFERPRQAQDCRQRQRDRVHLERDPDLRRRPQDRLALHRARQADPERLHRELQRPPARRAPERDAVLVLDHARATLAAWRDDYNTERPHSALGWQTPGGLRRSTRRNGRSAPRNGGVPPIAHCSIRASGQLSHAGSGFRWMSVGVEACALSELNSQRSAETASLAHQERERATLRRKLEGLY